ncbi:unnamed protein product [Staurois parvus]|uniref:Uncharacterized protein n=1 Tax=Staurois parvus TaxID=386267 RepID=A0ABN9E620_9NEOB|nr:unnamed protein product [Staurois parvus]
MGAAEFVGCQSGFVSTSGRILGALRACVRILGGCKTILVLATSLYCTYETRHITKSYYSAGI